MNDASYSQPTNTPLPGNIGNGGYVPTGTAFQTTIQLAHGTMTLNPSTGEFTYAANSKYSGTETLSVRVCLQPPDEAKCDDATLTFEIKNSGSETGSSATPVPTLNEWSGMGLTSLVAMLGAVRLRRRQN
ncbi:IPTL-CTERM sorting domain-containing protein [Comamonas sediminis]|uniref:IPTL-CTERM sorting domain-containing protein n=1 Tax=Comamonas sediminis TaxID=1783360 RepID=UPI003D299614